MESQKLEIVPEEWNVNANNASVCGKKFNSFCKNGANDDAK